MFFDLLLFTQWYWTNIYIYIYITGKFMIFKLFVIYWKLLCSVLFSEHIFSSNLLGLLSSESFLHPSPTCDKYNLLAERNITFQRNYIRQLCTKAGESIKLFVCSTVCLNIRVSSYSTHPKFNHAEMADTRA